MSAEFQQQVAPLLTNKVTWQNFEDTPDQALQALYEIRHTALKMPQSRGQSESLKLNLSLAPSWTTASFNICPDFVPSIPLSDKLAGAQEYVESAREHAAPLLRANEDQAFKALLAEYLELRRHVAAREDREWLRLWNFDRLNQTADCLTAEDMKEMRKLDLSDFAMHPRGFFRGQILSTMTVDEQRILVSATNPPRPARDEIVNSGPVGGITILLAQLSAQCLPEEVDALMKSVQPVLLCPQTTVNGVILILREGVSSRLRAHLRDKHSSVIVVDDVGLGTWQGLRLGSHGLPYCLTSLSLDLIAGILPGDDSSVSDTLCEEIVRHRHLIPSAWLSEAGNFSMLPSQLRTYRLPAENQLIVCTQGLANTNLVGRHGRHCICLVPPKLWVRLDINMHKSSPISRRIRVQTCPVMVN